MNIVELMAVPPAERDSGWLEAAVYQPLVDKAWQAILTRTAADGRVFDVSESTGTRGLTYNDYVRRAAILDRDPRGGAMALLFAMAAGPVTSSPGRIPAPRAGAC